MKQVKPLLVATIIICSSILFSACTINSGSISKNIIKEENVSVTPSPSDQQILDQLNSDQDPNIDNTFNQLNNDLK